MQGHGYDQYETHFRESRKQDNHFKMREEKDYGSLSHPQIQNYVHPHREKGKQAPHTPQTNFLRE